MGLKDGFDPKYSKASDYSEEDFDEDNIFDMTTLKLLLTYIDKLIQEGGSTQELNEQKNYLIDLKARLIKKNEESKNEWLKKKADPNYRGSGKASTSVASTTSTNSSSFYNPSSSVTPKPMSPEARKHLVMGFVFLFGGIFLGGIFDIIFLVRVNDGKGGNAAALVWFFLGAAITILGIILGVVNFKKKNRY